MLPYSSGVDKDKGRKEYQVALQKAVTQKLMTPGSRFAGLKGQTGGKFDGVSTVLNDKPAVLVKNVKFQDGANSFGKEGYVPNTIQLGGTTLYGLQQGNNVVFSPKTKTPLMESFKPTVDTPDPDPDPPVGPPSPSADPRNAEYLTARGKLTKDSTAEDIKKVEDIGMTAWAKANPKLAAKVKPGQSGYELIQNMKGQGTEAYDKTDTFKPSDIPEADRQNPVDQATALGITDLKDAQVFKDNAMTALLTNFGNTDYKPIVEGITLPTTTDYAGAFNQTDVPDLQSMMNMGEQLGNYGIESPLFSQGQKFKDLFQDAMLGK